MASMVSCIRRHVYFWIRIVENQSVIDLHCVNSTRLLVFVSGRPPCFLRPSDRACFQSGCGRTVLFQLCSAVWPGVVYGIQIRVFYVSAGAAPSVEVLAAVIPLETLLGFAFIWSYLSARLFSDTAKSSNASREPPILLV